MGGLISIERSIEVPSMYLCVEHQFYLELNTTIMSLFTKCVLPNYNVCQSQQLRYNSHEDSDEIQHYEDIIE